MAQRRMFSKTITNSARFLMMPQTSRLLYYDLGMAADDDGIVEAFTVLRMTGAAEDDLRVLAAKDFIIILNEELVSYIKDWKANNLVRTDRYQPSIYADLLVKVIGTEDGKPEVNQRLPQARQGQDRQGKDRSGQGRIGEGIRPPTLEDIAAYKVEICSNTDAERFYNYYAARGWKINGDPVTDWKALVRSWKATEKESDGLKTNNPFLRMLEEGNYE